MSRDNIPMGRGLIIVQDLLDKLNEHTENLVKQSKRLNCLTITLIILVVLTAVPAFWNLVLGLCEG